MNRTRQLMLAAGVIACAAVTSCLPFAAVHAGTGASPSAGKWDAQAAARYMDQREVWWQGWDHANRDHGTRCVSCHTQAPYALSRPILHSVLADGDLTPSETAMLADVERRVKNWDTMLPFYPDEVYGKGKNIESRNAESVLNAIILSSYDIRNGHLRDVTRLAFDRAWELQSMSGPDAGGWVWQDFEYTPWESKESQYHWAALMAMAVGRAPDNYRSDSKIAAHLAALHSYLQSHYDAQPLVNKVAALWASTVTPNLLSNAQRSQLAAELSKLQHADGGWSLTELGTWKRRDDTPLETRPDGYATGFVVLALEQSNLSKPQVQRGLDWLAANQDRTTGAWPAWSLNKNRDPKSPVGQFMSDAATGYAVLALEARH